MNYLISLKTVLLVVLITSSGALISCSFWQQDPLITAQKTLLSKNHLSAQYFGNSTILISDGQTKIMIDGFISRPSLKNVLLKKLTPNKSQIDKILTRGHVKKVDALFVAHSHYDHSLDAATVAKKTCAKIYGSLSTSKIVQAENFKLDRFKKIKHGDNLKIGLFEVKIFETPHAPNPKFKGNITKPFVSPSRVSAYKQGKTYSFLLKHKKGSVLIVPSANFIPGLYKKMNVITDVVFLGIGRLSKQPKDFIPNYWNEVVEATEAKLVIPIHWDNFWKSLDKPLKPQYLFVDDIKQSVNQLNKLAGENENSITIKFAPLIDRFSLN